MVNDVFSFCLQLLQELVRELKNAKAEAIFMMVAIENVGWGSYRIRHFEGGECL